MKFPKLLAAAGGAFVQQQHNSQDAEFKRIQRLGQGDFKKHPIKHDR